MSSNGNRNRYSILVTWAAGVTPPAGIIATPQRYSYPTLRALDDAVAGFRAMGATVEQAS
jgi:hypothetical protein